MRFPPGFPKTRGAALMAVLGVAMLLGLILVLVLSLSLNRAKSTRHGIERMRSMYAAESGYWVALAKVLDDPSYADAGPETFSLTFPGEPQDITVRVTVRPIPGAPGQKKVESRVVYHNL